MKTLLTLAAFHLACGWGLGVVANDGMHDIPMVLYIGLFFSQTSLLGIWSALALVAWPLRLGVLLLGTVYLIIQVVLCMNSNEVEIYALVASSVFVIAAVMAIVRHWFARLKHFEGSAADAIARQPEGLQFSILHLMLLTFAAGVLIAVGRTLEPFYSAADDWSYVLTLAICFIAMGLTSVWAMLGRRHVAARCLVTFAIAMLVGMIPWWIDRDAELWLWIPIMLFQTACLLGSLGVVRILGWRLIRRRLATTDGREPTEEADLQVIASEK